MREILFKAKRVNNGEWVEGYLFFIEDMPHIICDGKEICMNRKNADLYATELYAVDKNTICQYTGLTDKNGNKIWENDVVLDETMKTAKVVYGEHNCDCCYGVYGWTFESIGNYHECCDIRKPDTVKVIGNIFDNTELLQ